ncbi:MAG TPA: class I SAM-dependent methyltransferase [Pyrinomonadaceae bacterium]|nr:class I SAM-dependent methyltransferase [Pyrinomonadaceae bacterium]
MGILGGEVGYRLLRNLVKVCPGNEITTAYDGLSKMEVFFGPQIWRELANKTVLDFGCEAGVEAIDMAQHGVPRVIGLDIREEPLASARLAAKKAGVEGSCVFTNETDEKVDVIVSLDAFEHFADPIAILDVMRRLLKDNGYVLTCFGPTWYHPLGGHGFSIFPWAHLVFTESVLMRWYREDSGRPVHHFNEVAGGLNQLTIRRFEKIVTESEFEFDSIQAMPIRKLRLISNRLTREFTTAVVKCKLVPKCSSRRAP